MTQLGIAIPPRNGEIDAAYTANVCAKLQPPWWYDYRYGGIGHDGNVPMLFDGNVERLAECADRVYRDAPNMPELILLMNEPEREKQADMTPEEAVTMLRRWWTRVSSWVIRCAVGGVNVSVHCGQTPYQWLDSFVGLLSDSDRLQIDYWHIHAYGNEDDFYDAVMQFREWMQTVHMVRPVIVSECGTDDNPLLLMQLIRAMLSDGILHMAAWFSAYYDKWNDTGLLDSDGNLTEIGQVWMKQQERHEVFLPQVTVAEVQRERCAI